MPCKKLVLLLNKSNETSNGNCHEIMTINGGMVKMTANDTQFEYLQK